MRPRHLLMLVLLAAVPIALAIALTRGSGSGTKAPATVAQVSLELSGDTGKATLLACGAAHHYAVYPAGATIPFRGTASVSGAWSVHLKLKACSGGTFEPSGDVPAGHRHGVGYRGSFAAPLAGFYFGRVELHRGSVVLARSNKRYFRVLSR